LAAEFGFDGNPGALEGFDIGGVVRGEGGEGDQGEESDANEFLHDGSFGLVRAMKARRSGCVKGTDRLQTAERKEHTDRIMARQNHKSRK
jgi:hypothetical protein